MTAEPIARVIDDLRKGRVRFAIDDHTVLRAAVDRLEQSETVVDATAIYRSLVAKAQPVDLYGDHPCIASPWQDAAVCYLNEHGNVIVMQLSARPWPAGRRWGTPNEVAWDELRWMLEAFIWVGGRGGTGSFPTTGPCHLMQYAVGANGEPADLHYVHLVPGYPLESWEMAQLTLLSSLNFMSCRNVELTEPQRKRPERRRLERLGVRVQTLTVRPMSRRTAGTGDGTVGAVPLHSVRGHFSEYGPQYGKGKLFGKYEGRYWIPAHARGSAGDGEIRKDYVLKP